MITRIPIESTLLASHGWEASKDDPTVGTLAVEFAKDKAVYTYDAVPLTVWNDFQKAESMGKFFLTKIKGQYAHKKLEAPKPDAEPGAAPKES